MLSQKNARQLKRFASYYAVFLFSIMLLCAAARVQAQAPQNFEQERDSAFKLLQEGKFAEARQSFEKLAAANSSDARVEFGLGFSILATSKSITDDSKRREQRILARKHLLRAKELGFEDDLLEAGLAAIPADGGEGAKFSNNPAADKAMQEGEAAFTTRDYDKAITAYERAFKLDPALYEAPLFIGDMYFQKQQWDKVGEAYARAIALNPDRETAYRYWSDALLKQKKMDEALAKSIEAIIAEPYNQMAFRGLLQWAQANNVKLAHPRIEPPNSTSTEGNQTKLTIDPKTLDGADGSNNWLLYDLTRVAWTKGEFAKAYPNEKTYRHSLREEAAAFKIVAEAAAKDLKSGKVKALSAPLSALVKLNEAGLLEAYILFARPDRGIAEDYASYRQSNRDKLRRYWHEIVAGK
jgi:tetratricopeptide (TPR) repeat protein